MNKIKLIFKQWINPPNKKSSKIRSQKMLMYIATRDGVAYNQDKDFGLLGKFNTMEEIEEIKSLDKARKHIYNMAKEQKTIYNAVISLKEQDAIEKELITKQDYDNYIKENIYDIAKEMNIPSKDLEFFSSVHYEKGRPHIHLMYWNKNQKIGCNFVKPEKSSAIRKKLNKKLFENELKQLLKEKDEITKSLLEITEQETLNNNLNVFKNMNLKQIKKLFNDNLNDKNRKLLNRKYSNKNDVNISNDILEIYKLIEKEYPKGTLKYGYLPGNIKQEIDNLSEKIIKQNPQIKNEFESLINNIKEYTSLLEGNKNTEKYIEKAKQDINKKISNKILNTIKDLKTEIKEKNQEINKVQFIKNKNADFLQSILDDIYYYNGGVTKNYNNMPKSKTEMSSGLSAELERRNQDRRN